MRIAKLAAICDADGTAGIAVVTEGGNLWFGWFDKESGRFSWEAEPRELPEPQKMR